MISVIIPSRNEPYLQQTILDVLKKCRGEIEIIAILDGYWEQVDKIVDDPRVNYLHFTTPRGMRNGINSAAALSRGEYLLKLDAHCMLAEGFDEVLKANHQPNWIQIPSRLPLDPIKWAIEERNDNKYPIEQHYLSETLQGVEWRDKRDQEKDKEIVDTPMSQGSCWFMTKEWYNKLGLLDEEKWGKFYYEFLEIALKCHPAGGECKVNKKTWYAHWHKNEGRGYSLDKDEREKATPIIASMGQEIAYIRNKFKDMPQ